MNTAVVQIRKLISKNKAVAAGLTAFGLALAGAAQNAIADGVIDTSQIEIAGGGLVAAIIIAGVTYLTSAGDAEVELPQPDKQGEGIVTELGATRP